MNLEDIQFRLAQSTDCTAVAQCAKAAYQQYVQAIGKEPAPMCADFESLIIRGVVDIAIVDEVLVGFIVYYPLIDEAESTALFIENIAVLPDKTGMGVGAYIMAHIERRARESAIKYLRLYTNAKMTQNLAWYRKLGFLETRRVHEDGFDRVYFEKKLTA